MRPEMFAELEKSVRQMKAIQNGTLKGKVTTAEDLKDVLSEAAKARLKLGLSQAQFAELMGISKRTLEGWEQGRRSPEGPAQVLLRIAAERPDAVLEVVGAETVKASRGLLKVKSRKRARA